ncbi:hypothetical protein EDB83DRAFT_2202430, partial [Lactarius deliciosus]
EAKLQEASDAVTDGTFKNLAIAARHFNVPYDTLRRRHHKLAAPRTKSQVTRQLLSEAQELALCEWIKYMGRIGYPLSKQNLCAKELLPSKNWINKFLGRHTDVLLKRPTGLDAQRVRCFNPTII